MIQSILLTEVSRSKSPNGKYTETLLLGNGGATTGFATLVKINSKIVFGVNGDFSQDIKIEWLNNNHLKIIYKGDIKDIYKYEKEYKNVKIEIINIEITNLTPSVVTDTDSQTKTKK